MKKLATTFRQGGFTFTLLHRTGDVAVFEKRRRPTGSPSFEVVIIRRHAGYTVAGRKIEPAEHMPADENWGRLGWTYTTLDDAMRRYEDELQCPVRVAPDLYGTTFGAGSIMTADHT